jgi:gluconolactonase
LWYGEPINLANGLALGPDGHHLYAVFRTPIQEGGSAGSRQEVAALPGALPDGLAFDTEGNLYVGCYEPSQELRVAPTGRFNV